MLKQLRVLAWRYAPKLCHAISIRMPPIRAFWRYGYRRRRGVGLADGPVIVAGFHGAVLGLGEAARGTVTALETTGLRAHAWDISETLGHKRQLEVGDPAPPPAGPGVLITQMNPTELIRLVDQTRGAPFEGRRSIGYWAWALPDIPRSWKAAFRYVDEIWTPSHFSADAIRRSAPRNLPIRVVPHRAHLDLAAPAHERFGIDPDRVIILSAFDLRSTLARKNPFAALEAFRRATAIAGRPATLVFKTVAGDVVPESLARLKAAIGDTPDVVLLIEALPPEGRDQLMATCDIFLSLHRSEGFGLLLAEAMAARKAVVTTGWSGNLDFMDQQSAVLVPYTLTPVEDAQGLYRGGVWADPDIAFAAEAMAQLIDDPARRQALGARAREKVERALSPHAVADLMRRLLDGDSASASRPGTPEGSERKSSSSLRTSC